MNLLWHVAFAICALYIVISEVIRHQLHRSAAAAAPVSPYPTAAAAVAGAELYECATDCGMLAVAPFPFAPYQLPAPPTQACRNCGHPIEKVGDPQPLTAWRWRHVSGGPACWLMPYATDALFGRLAEPERVCGSCGVTENQADCPLVGSSALSADGTVTWLCADPRACLISRTVRDALEDPSEPLCPCGSGKPRGACPGRWHFAGDAR